MSILNSEVKKLVKYGIGFLCFLVLILASVEWILSVFVTYSDDSQTGKVNRVMNHSIDPDLMILGSSVAEVGFNSNIIEVSLKNTVYNLGIDGTKITSSEFLINEFLSYSQNCKTILIGMAFFSLSETGAMTAPERFLAHKSNIYVKNNIELVSPSLYNKLYKVPFYSFIVSNHTYYKNAFIGANNIFFNKNHIKDPLKGFVPNNNLYEDTWEKKNINEKIILSNSSIKAYLNILKRIKDNNITPVLVITPMYKNGQQSFTNYAEYLNAVKKLAKESNTILLDYSSHEITYDKTNFYNNGHLNALGSLKFSEVISDSLLMREILSPN